MNRPIAEPNKLIKFTFHRFFEKSMLSQAFFWQVAASFLFFFTLKACFIKETPFASWISYLVPLGAFLCLRFKTWGLMISQATLATFFLLYFKTIPPSEKLWHTGLVLVSALDFLIVLLAREEAVSFFEKTLASKDALVSELKNKESLLLAAKQVDEDERKTLLEELQKLKEEAELRKIERQNHMRQMELIHSEISLLNAQKESILNDAGACAEKWEAIRVENVAIIQKHASLLEEIKREKEEFNKIDVERQSLLKKNQELGFEKDEVALKVHQLLESQSMLEEELTLQKQQHFQEKEEKEKTALFSKEQALLYQEKILQYQSMCEKAKISHMQNEKVKESERVYKQLRLQFDEKSRILSETRKELFHTHTRLMALERDKKEESFLPSEESKLYAHELERLSTYVESLEEEISHLEELISRALLQ